MPRMPELGGVAIDLPCREGQLSRFGYESGHGDSAHSALFDKTLWLLPMKNSLPFGFDIDSGRLASKNPTLPASW